MSRWSLPERQAVGKAKSVGGCPRRWPFGLTTLFLGFATAPLAAAEVHEVQIPPGAAGVDVPDPPNAGLSGVDIRIADLLAGGSVLAGVAPRPDTSGIGADLERDLFPTGVPLNAPATPPPENDLLSSY